MADDLVNIGDIGGDIVLVLSSFNVSVGKFLEQESDSQSFFTAGIRVRIGTLLILERHHHLYLEKY